MTGLMSSTCRYTGHSSTPSPTLTTSRKRVLHTRLPRKWWQRSKVCRGCLRSNLILFFGATYGWDKLDNALNHSHLPSSTKIFAKMLGVKAGDVSKALVPFLPKHRPPFTTQTYNHSLPQQHYNAPLHPAPTFQQSFPMPPPAPPPYVNGHAGGNRSGPPCTSCAHTHGHNQSAANGFRRPGYNGYNKFIGTPR